MSSSQFSSKEIDANLGRHNIHAELDHSKLNPTLPVGQTTVTQSTGLTSMQTTGLESVQTTALISNEPKTVITQEQRLAANMPITTEKHVMQEFVPVIHEEIVTTIPVVTGQAVHTGQAIAGQTFVQQLGSQFIQQQALTKVDLIPQVQTQLGAQHVVNIQSTSAPQMIGKATVLTSQQVNQQGFISQPTTLTTQQMSQQGFMSQPVVTQQVTKEIFTQPTVFTTEQVNTGIINQQPMMQNLTTTGVPMTQSIPMSNVNVINQQPAASFHHSHLEKKF
jgi:hypothetical protein